MQQEPWPEQYFVEQPIAELQDYMLACEWHYGCGGMRRGEGAAGTAVVGD